MSRDVQASGFGMPWDGTYEYQYTDHWSNGDYWILRNSLYWFVTDSEFEYGEERRKASLAYYFIENPRGSYTGLDGNPNGTIS